MGGRASKFMADQAGNAFNRALALVAST
jgi:hypothetical protein